MKKLIAVAVLSALIGFSCSRPTKEDTAQLLIKEMLLGTMYHPDSYESVSFGTLDSLYSHVEEDSVYIASKIALTNLTVLIEREKKAKARNEKTINSWDRFYGIARHIPHLENERRKINKRLNTYNSQIDSLQQRLDSIAVNFNPAFIGYTMEHRFKYLARGGYAMENTTLFYLDPDITMVTRFKDDLGLIFEYNPTTNKYEPK